MFSERTYWDERYTNDSAKGKETFEWFVSWQEMKPYFDRVAAQTM